ncbi:MAG: uracil phosphoribosyltransferase [Deltaproteobacteria bacterium]|nr:uracil phosphoribosyltransferase [Deltaproteobacteria bacterium]
MLINLGAKPSLITEYLNQLRDVEVQSSRLLFRKNIERLGALFAYEISQKLKYKPKQVQTPLGVITCPNLVEQPVVASILRAGLPFQQGIMNFFDDADSCFVSAYRKHKPDGSFEIELGYQAHPRLDDRILIIADPMLATGRSMVSVYQKLVASGKPKETHMAVIVASQTGVDYVQNHAPEVNLWTGAIDPELNKDFYIVPGLGDAGDLAFGEKIQH